MAAFSRKPDDEALPSLLDRLIPPLWNAVQRTSFRQPFLQISVNLQTHPGNARVRAGVVPPFKGWLDCYTRLKNANGFRSLWRGNVLNISTRVLTYLMNFGFAKGLPSSSNRAMYTFAPIITAAILYPLETLVTRACVDPNWRLMSFWSSPRGLRGLYDGFFFHLATLLLRRVIDGVAFKIATNLPERLGRMLVYRASLIASLFATYPLDTALHRIQVQSELPLAQHRYAGGIDCIRKVASEEGAMALYCGSAYQLLIGLTGVLGDAEMFAAPSSVVR